MNMDHHAWRAVNADSKLDAIALHLRGSSESMFTGVHDMSRTDGPIRVGAVKQLFLDDHVIAGMDRCDRQYHRPSRVAPRPLIQADRPWERGGNGVYLFGGTVLFDEEEDVFKMWYRTSRVEPGVGSEAVGGSPDEGMKSCYAVSTDGLEWQKPALNLTDFDGSRDNNILPPGRDVAGSRQWVRRPNLIKDIAEPDPLKRYKMIYCDQIHGRNVLVPAFSSDGIHWQMHAGPPISFQEPLHPMGVLFGWDRRLERYVLFHRKCGSVRADVDGRMVRQEFALVRSTSSDFVQWGDTIEIIRRDPQFDPPRWSAGHVGVLAAMLYTDDLYIGFLDTCTTYHVEEVPPELWHVLKWDHVEHRTELIFSRDGVNWTRPLPHWEFLRPEPRGSWDTQFVALSNPIVHEREIWLYYTGRDVSCGAALIGHPQRQMLIDEVDQDGVQRHGYAIGLAKLRLDGFVSIDAGNDPGTLTTKPMLFEGDRLMVNLRAPERSFDSGHLVARPFGTARVEILDESGGPLDGFSCDCCDPFTGDATKHVMTWNGNPDVSHLAGIPVRLRVHLKNAALYSIQFGSG